MVALLFVGFPLPLSWLPWPEPCHNRPPPPNPRPLFQPSPTYQPFRRYWASQRDAGEGYPFWRANLHQLNPSTTANYLLNLRMELALNKEYVQEKLKVDKLTFLSNLALKMTLCLCMTRSSSAWTCRWPLVKVIFRASVPTWSLVNLSGLAAKLKKWSWSHSVDISRQSSLSSLIIKLYYNKVDKVLIIKATRYYNKVDEIIIITLTEFYNNLTRSGWRACFLVWLCLKRLCLLL